MNNGFYEFSRGTDRNTGLSIDTGSFATTGSNQFSGSQTITGSLNVTQGITGSLFGTASFVTTASYIQNAQSASYVLQAVSSSFAISSSFSTTASFALNAGTTINTGSFVTTSSFNSFTSSYNTGSFTGSFTGSLFGTASFATTASYALNGGVTQIVAGTNVTITNGGSGSVTINAAGSGGSIDTGSFATTGSNTFIGNQVITGSLNVTQGITGSLFGTASWANNVISASYALTASYSKNLQISGSINNVDYIDFNTGSVVTQPTPGRLSWNNTDGTLDIGLKGSNVTLQIGQEEVARVVNKTGANLLEADYYVVRVRSVAEGGAQGQRLAVVLAQGDNDANSATTLGVVTENIDNNQEGFVTTTGQVRGINTTGTIQGETWVDGDILYLSPTTPGHLTNIKPQAPQHTVIVGFVEYAHNNQGKIFVKVDNGYEIDELHNVKINTGSLTSGQLLVRSGSVWINSTQLTGSYGLTGSLQATSFTGSLFGTASFATTASYVVNAQSASYVLQAVSSSFATTASYASNGGVTSIVAGTNITISSATGSVTINSTGGGGVSKGLVQAMTLGLQNIF
jgi:hypothetical protein